MSKEKKEECFIIMPISDVDGYENGHFTRVYEDLIIPAVELSNFNPIRSDEVKQTNLIHLDILQQLIDAPIAVCDLSTRNPNVLFELGIRQAFDKPVVLIQEKGTPKIFDISGLIYVEYQKTLKYRDVLKSQKEISESITATFNSIGKKGNINSIVKLLGLSDPAMIPEIEGDKREALSLSLIQDQISDLKKLIEINILTPEEGRVQDYIAVEFNRIVKNAEDLKKASKTMPYKLFIEKNESLRKDCEILFKKSEDKLSKELIQRLLNRLDFDKFEIESLHLSEKE